MPDDDNPLGPPPQVAGPGLAAPAAPPSPGLSVSAPGGPSIGDAMATAHNHAVTLFNHTSDLMAKNADVQRELRGIVEMGPAVEVDDVLNMAGRLVASGHFSPMHMATLLSNLPDNGPGIENWAGQQLAQVVRNGQQITQMHAVAQHEMGVSAGRLLEHLGNGGGGNMTQEVQRAKSGPPAAGGGLATATPMGNA